MILVLDTGILGQLCHPRNTKNRPVAEWLNRLLDEGGDAVTVILPEICDYELRRKLLHLIAKGQSTEKSVRRLDELAMLLTYLPLDTDTMRHAAELWSQARQRGLPTAPEQALDGDMILAAQSGLVDGTIVTTNRRHLEPFVSTTDWHDVQVPRTE